MTQTLIEKARQQRRNALRHSQAKPPVARQACESDIKNIFDVSGWGQMGRNIVTFHSYRADAKQTLVIAGRLH